MKEKIKKIFLIIFNTCIWGAFVFFLVGVFYCLFNMAEVEQWGLFWFFVLMMLILGYFLFRHPIKVLWETIKKNKLKNIKQEEIQIKKNKLAVTGFILGLMSIPFGFIGITPVLALVLSGIGLYQIKKNGEKGEILAIIGLILGIIYTLSYLRTYGHI